MFEFFRRKNAEESTSEGEEAKALAEGESESGEGEERESGEGASSDDRVLRDAVEAMLTSREEGDSVEVDIEDEKTAIKPTPQPKSESGVPVNVIGADTKVGGDLLSKNAVLVLGEIEGNVLGLEVTVEKDGRIVGDVGAKQDVIIRGTVEGNLRVQGKLTITASGSVTGGVKAKSIAIEEGGELRGRCSMAADGSNLSVVSAS